jgi:hypothetical protein
MLSIKAGGQRMAEHSRPGSVERDVEQVQTNFSLFLSFILAGFSFSSSLLFSCVSSVCFC